MSERLSYEHVGLFGVFVNSPTFLVELDRGSERLGAFGFYVMTRAELEDAILFRATHLLKCSMMDSKLTQVIAKISCAAGFMLFKYEEECFGFRYVTSRGHADEVDADTHTGDRVCQEQCNPSEIADNRG